MKNPFTLLNRFTVLLGAALLICQASYSQSGANDSRRAEVVESHQKYLEELNLTEEQKPRFEAINETYRNELRALGNSGGTRMEKLRNLQRINGRRDQEMKKILTDEQYTIYRKMQKEMKAELRSERR